jgi:hypothetical protein
VITNTLAIPTKSNTMRDNFSGPMRWIMPND